MLTSYIKGMILLLFCVCMVVPHTAFATTVRMQTVLGIIDIALYDAEAPATVRNFLQYVTTSAYNNSIIHRSMPGFIIQGGGYSCISSASCPKTIVAGTPVINEFSVARPNVRGTIAMAKVAGDPNSATTGWFINLVDNSANLNYQNGGFTVFGKVIGNGMAVVDAIANRQIVNAGGAFSSLPLITMPLSQSNLITVQSVSTLSTATDSDRLFNYLEALYPQYLSPATNVSVTDLGYYFRYYPGTGAYTGTANGYLYYLGPLTSNTVTSLGPVADWLAAAIAAGY